MSGKWRKLMLKLSRELTDKDIEELKYSLEIPAGVTQGLKTSLQLFKYLEGRGIIVQDDYISLMKLFEDLENGKPLQMVKSFANDNNYTNHESCPSFAQSHVAPRVQQPRVQPPRPQPRETPDSPDVPDAPPSHVKCEGIHLCIIFFFGEEDKTTNEIIRSTFKRIGFQVSNIYRVTKPDNIVEQIKHFGAKGDYDSVVIFLLGTPALKVFHETCKALNNEFKETVPRILFEWHSGGDGKTDTTEPFPKTHRLKLLTTDKTLGRKFMKDVCKIVSKLPTLDEMWSCLQTSDSSTATPTGNLPGSYRIGSSTNFIFKNSAVEATLAASDPVSAEMVLSERQSALDDALARSSKVTEQMCEATSNVWEMNQLVLALPPSK